MRVSQIEQREVDDGIEWSARLTVADQEHTLRFGGPAELVSDADSSMFLAAALLPAMAWAHDLEIEGSVSTLMLSRMERLARSFQKFDPSLRIPTITPEAVAPRARTGTMTGAFFSRGVDSTFSAAIDRTDPAPLDALVYCSTLEPNHDDQIRGSELAQVRVVAERIGLPLHVIWTNMREFTDPIAGWSTMHGSGLGAMSQLVGQAFTDLVIPTAYDINAMSPCGSHPGTDPLFSSEAVTVHHDHTDRSRQDKVDWLVANRPDLLDLLKVCYSENRTDNCGTCHKCLLTLTSLRAAGGTHHTSLFPTALDLDLVRAQRQIGIGSRQLWLPIAWRAREVGDLELAEAIEDMLHLSALPSLSEIVATRWPKAAKAIGRGGVKAYDPERATAFERFDRAYTNSLLAMIRHGEVLPRGGEPPENHLRTSTAVGSVVASLRHRFRR